MEYSNLSIVHYLSSETHTHRVWENITILGYLYWAMQGLERGHRVLTNLKNTNIISIWSRDTKLSAPRKQFLYIMTEIVYFLLYTNVYSVIMSVKSKTLSSLCLIINSVPLQYMSSTKKCAPSSLAQCR